MPILEKKGFKFTVQKDVNFPNGERFVVVLKNPPENALPYHRQVEVICYEKNGEVYMSTRSQRELGDAFESFPTLSELRESETPLVKGDRGSYTWRE